MGQAEAPVTARPNACVVCGFGAATILEAVAHIQDTENEDQHRRFLSAMHGTGLTADIERLAKYRRAVTIESAPK